MTDAAAHCCLGFPCGARLPFGDALCQCLLPAFSLTRRGLLAMSWEPDSASERF